MKNIKNYWFVKRLLYLLGNRFQIMGTPFKTNESWVLASSLNFIGYHSK